MIIDWGNKIINVEKADLLQLQTIPYEIFQLDIPTFKAILGDFMSSDQGMIYSSIFNHNPAITIGGVTLAKVVEILDPYTITFEDGQYAVNLVGANSNIGDRVNLNQVSIRSANSAGLAISSGGNVTSSGLTLEEHNRLMDIPTNPSGLTTAQNNKLMSLPASGVIADAVWSKALS
jgi:hypothetical protein